MRDSRAIRPVRAARVPAKKEHNDAVQDQMDHWRGVLAVAVIGGGTGIAVAASSGDDEEPLTGSTRNRAVDAALEETGGGTVTETEAGDDGAAYSVEVRLEDGSQVEVNLDENFTVIGQDADGDGPNDDEGQNEDEGENDDD